MNGGGSESGLDRADAVAIVLSALLLDFAGPPGPGAALVFVALVPFLLRWVRRRDVAGPLWSARYGAALFAAFWSIELLWVLRIARVGWWAIPAWIGQVAVLALLGALFGFALYGARRLPLAIGAPIAWAGVEVLRADLLGPLRFPWSPLALPLTGLLPWLQGAAWVGETGVAMALVAFAALGTGVVARVTPWLAEPVEFGGAPRRDVPGAVLHAVLALALYAGWGLEGAQRMVNADARPVETVVVLQPDVPLEVREGDEGIERSLAAIEALLVAAVRAGPGEIVLPETAVPADLNAPELRERIEGWTRTTGRAFWVGGFAVDDQGGRRNVIERFPAPGEDAAEGVRRWEKVGIVPGVEFGSGEGYRAGSPTQLPISTSDGSRIGALICIESAWTGLAIRHAGNGADWLLNVTNDAWLGETPEWTRTAAFAAHPAHLSLRAIETGLGIVRVGNNGWTGVVEPTGVRTEAIPPFMAGVRSARVSAFEARPPAVRWGGWIRIGALLGLLALVARGAVDRD